MRVECAKCRRECDLSGPRATLCGDRACRVREIQARVRFAVCPATLCGDRACRVREIQARVRFAGCPRNPLRRSCVSSARNAGESAICEITLLLPLPAAHMLMTMSWAVTAWPPVGAWEACALLRSSPLTGHCFETLLAHLPRHFSVLIPVRSFP